jgi:hypothetical protein
LLGQRGTPPQSRYIFKHALIRDAAVLSILNARKRKLHQSTQFSRTVSRSAETEPELLMPHQTNLADQALGYWRQAAERPKQLAYIEGSVTLTGR